MRHQEAAQQGMLRLKVAPKEQSNSAPIFSCFFGFESIKVF